MDAKKIEEMKDFVEHRKQSPSDQSLDSAFGESAIDVSMDESSNVESEAASVFKDGQVITIHSVSELKAKVNAASEASRLSILYFTAAWCGPCRYVAPLFTSLAAQYPNAVFLKVDIDEARDVAAEWRPSCVPCFVFVRSGVEVEQFIGVYKSEIEKKFAQHCG